MKIIALAAKYHRTFNSRFQQVLLRQILVPAISALYALFHSDTDVLKVQTGITQSIHKKSTVVLSILDCCAALRLITKLCYWIAENMIVHRLTPTWPKGNRYHKGIKCDPYYLHNFSLVLKKTSFPHQKDALRKTYRRHQTHGFCKLLKLSHQWINRKYKS